MERRSPAREKGGTKKNWTPGGKGAGRSETRIPPQVVFFPFDRQRRKEAGAPQHRPSAPSGDFSDWAPISASPPRRHRPPRRRLGELHECASLEGSPGVRFGETRSSYLRGGRRGRGIGPPLTLKGEGAPRVSRDVTADTPGLLPTTSLEGDCRGFALVP